MFINTIIQVKFHVTKQKKETKEDVGGEKIIELFFKPIKKEHEL